MPYFKKIYIYRESRMPEDGWLQPCFQCYTITGSLFLLRTKQTLRNLYEIEVYLCAQCKKEMKENTELHIKFTERCNKYIKKNIKF